MGVKSRIRRKSTAVPDTARRLESEGEVSTSDGEPTLGRAEVIPCESYGRVQVTCVQRLYLWAQTNGTLDFGEL